MSQVNKYPKIMGVLNLTPDSFYDGNKYNSIDLAFNHFKSLLEQGADIIDIGGESSRPGSVKISVEEELNRVIPVLKKILEYIYQKKLNITISIDTYKPEVAESCLELNEELYDKYVQRVEFNGEVDSDNKLKEVKKVDFIINDITGMTNLNLRDIVSKYNCRVVIMHMLGNPQNMQQDPKYDDVVDEINDFFTEQIRQCLNSGIEKSNIILDPGIGFGKRLKDNILIFQNIDNFKSHACQILIGASRKSFINMISKSEAEDRLPGTIASTILCYEKGVDIIRVHDVKENIQALKVWCNLKY